MNNDSHETRLKNRTEESDLPLELNREWSDVVRASNTLNTDLIVFDPKSKEHNHWALSIESEAAVLKNYELNIFNKSTNNLLKNSFKKQEAAKLKYWNTLFASQKLTGYFIPKHDVNEVPLHRVKSHILFHKTLFQIFQFPNFFLSLYKGNKVLKEKKYAAAHSIWFYIYYYSVFLKELKRDSPSQYKEYGNWFSKQLDLDSFYSKLPSEQITMLLLHKCESIIDGTDNQWHKKRILNKANKAVGLFFEKYEKDFNEIFGNSDTSKSINIDDNSTYEIKRDFSEIFTIDYNDLLVQELLDNKSGIWLSIALPYMMQLKYGPASLSNATHAIKDILLNIEDDQLGIFNNENTEPLSLYRNTIDPYPKNEQYWFDISPKKRTEIIYLINHNTTEKKHTEAKSVIDRRCTEVWDNMLNTITAPILYWERGKNILLPQWNLLEDDYTLELKALNAEKEEKRAQENILLKQHLSTISAMESLEKLEQYVATKSPIFFYNDFYKTWNYQVNRKTIQFKQRALFYENRMKEFGIYEANINSRIKKDFLEEMINIEEEIKPYIAFVKKAFQAALPIRKSVTFSKYRHSTDGVEFDPDTLFQQEKWIRADVMKVMQSKIEEGEAVQINTFCLDYSGSMDQDRMRNLFKMLYLLVLGLEDRKSYDAFHFFSNRFIDVVDFSSEFTNRKVLFKILRQITNIVLGKVKFSGEGGTNISEGINKSHQKMKEFIKDFKQRNPGTNIASSIFVITDGEPSLGITQIPVLKEFIEEKRQDGDIEIKGIFIKSEDDVNVDIMRNIFGEDHFIETQDFQEGVNRFVNIMTDTYKKQRKTFVWKQKKIKLGLTK